MSHDLWTQEWADWGRLGGKGGLWVSPSRTRPRRWRTPGNSVFLSRDSGTLSHWENPWRLLVPRRPMSTVAFLGDSCMEPWLQQSMHHNGACHQTRSLQVGSLGPHRLCSVGDVMSSWVLSVQFGNFASNWFGYIYLSGSEGNEVLFLHGTFDSIGIMKPQTSG